MIDLNPERDISSNSRQTTSKRSKSNNLVTEWKKFEYFAFPVKEDNAFYIEIQRHFEHLKQSYIEFNYICPITGAIDFASVFVDQNYDGLTKDAGRRMKREHMKKFKREPVTLQKEKVDKTLVFNGEELFFMNRIAFKLFKQRGARMIFADFLNDLLILQHGTFEESLTLWLELANDTDKQIKK